MTWEAADVLTICGVEYNVTLDPHSSVSPRPSLTFTPVLGGTAFTLYASCYGQGWAEFHGPKIDNEAICTETVVEDCPGKNSFTVRVECTCIGMNYNGTGWYVLQTTTGYGNWGTAVLFLIDPCIPLCPGGPYGTEALALENTCFVTPECALYTGIVVPLEAEIEFYDGTDAFVDWNGLVDVFEFFTNLAFDSCNPASPTYPPDTGIRVQGQVCSGGITVPGAEFWVDLLGAACPGIAPRARSTVEPVVTGTGPTFQAVFTDMVGIIGSGVVSAVIRARNT